MKIFDVHCHIYPDFLASRVVENLSKAYDGFPIQNDGTLSTLMDGLNRAGGASAAIHSVATTAHQVASINRFILESAAAHPGRLTPFATLHPDLPDFDAAMDEILSAGFKGVKLHPEFQNFKVDDPRAVALFRAIAGKLPVLLHCGDFRCDHSAPERILAMLEKAPDLTLICAHLGGWTTWERSAHALRGADLWVDTSSSLYALDAPTATAIIRSYGADRVLYGTDYPVWTPEEELQRFMALPLTDGEREKILWSNHLTLLGDKI